MRTCRHACGGSNRSTASNFDRIVSFDPLIAETAARRHPRVALAAAPRRRQPLHGASRGARSRRGCCSSGARPSTARSCSRPLKRAHRDRPHRPRPVRRSLLALPARADVQLNLHNNPYPTFENRVCIALAAGHLVISEPLSPTHGLQARRALPRGGRRRSASSSSPRRSPTDSAAFAEVQAAGAPRRERFRASSVTRAAPRCVRGRRRQLGNGRVSAPPRTHTPTVPAGALPARHASRRRLREPLRRPPSGGAPRRCPDRGRDDPLHGLRAAHQRFQPDEWYFTELARMIAHDFPARLAVGLYLRGVSTSTSCCSRSRTRSWHADLLRSRPRRAGAPVLASAALPVWLLGRAGGLGARAPCCAALVLAVPWAVISTSFLAEPAAYPAFAWVLYTTWFAAQRPSRAVEVFALVALAVAALSRTQFLALPPILPLGGALAGVSLRARRWGRAQRARAPPAAVVASSDRDRHHGARVSWRSWRARPALLPGGGVAKLTEITGYRTWNCLAILGRDATTSRGSPLAPACSHSCSAWADPAHARAPARSGGPRARGRLPPRPSSGLSLSLLQAGTTSVTSSTARSRSRSPSPRRSTVACAARGRDRGRGRDRARRARGDTADRKRHLALAPGPYDFFIYPAGVFFGRVVVGKLSLLHLASRPNTWCRWGSRSSRWPGSSPAGSAAAGARARWCSRWACSHYAPRSPTTRSTSTRPAPPPCVRRERSPALLGGRQRPCGSE